MKTNTSNNDEHKKLIKKDLDTSFDFLEKCRSGSYRIKDEYFWALKNVIWTLHKSKEFEQGYAKAQDEWMNKILPEQLDVSIKEERKRTLDDVEKIINNFEVSLSKEYDMEDEEPLILFIKELKQEIDKLKERK